MKFNTGDTIFLYIIKLKSIIIFPGIKKNHRGMKPKIKKMYGLGLVVEYFRLTNRCF